jgi:hypothetical protein
MNKFQVFGTLLIALVPLNATSSKAQGVFTVPAPMPMDLIGIQQTGELCKNNPSLRRDKPGFCKGKHYSDYYKRRSSNQNRRRVTRPNTNTSRPNNHSSRHAEVSPSCHNALENAMNALEAVDTSAPRSSVELQLQKVQQANEFKFRQCN